MTINRYIESLSVAFLYKRFLCLLSFRRSDAFSERLTATQRLKLLLSVMLWRFTDIPAFDVSMMIVWRLHFLTCMPLNWHELSVCSLCSGTVMSVEICEGFFFAEAYCMPLSSKAVNFSFYYFLAILRYRLVLDFVISVCLRKGLILEYLHKILARVCRKLKDNNIAKHQGVSFSYRPRSVCLHLFIL